MTKAIERPVQPLVTVEMITYNHEAYIAQAIESVLMQQTTFSFRLLICEDCSTDKTPEICRSYSAMHPDKIELNLNRQNLGVMRNAKKLHDLSFKSGSKYIAMCDGDDYWIDPYKLQKQVDFLELNSNFAMVFHNTYDLSSGVISQKYSNPMKDEFSINDFVLFLYARTVSIMFRRPFDKLPSEFEKIKIGDWALSIIVLQYGKAKYLDECMSVYRVHNSGVWNGANAAKNMVDVFNSFRTLRKVVGDEFKPLIDSRLMEFSFSYLVACLKRMNFFDFGIGFFYFIKAPIKYKKSKAKSMYSRVLGR